MADEVKSVKDEMNGKSELLPAKWNRFTVADGDWMQSKTLQPLTARDNFLAEQIDKSTTDWQDALSSESATRYSDDQYLSASISSLSGEFYTFSADDYYPTVTNLSSLLNYEISRATQAETTLSGRISLEETTRSAADARLQEQIDKLQAATDVIAVFGTYDEFVAGSGDLGVTDNDTIKVLRDNTYTPAATDEDNDSNDDDGFQVYYEWHDPDAEEPHTDWTGWSAIGSLDPYYSVAEIDEYKDEVASDFASLSATVANNYLSAKGAVHQGKNIIVTEDTNKPEITISTSADVEFTNVSSTNISATNVTALTATGNSAKFTNISATNISANLFKTSDLGTVDTFQLEFDVAHGASLTATEANVLGLTANTLYGQSYNSNVDSLISSAEYGEFAYNVINRAKFSAVDTTTSTAYISGGFAIKAGDNLSLSYADKTITLNAGDTGITAISAGNTKYTGPVFSASAGTGINFVNGNNNVLGIKASDNLINSATGGSAAYNWITGQSATLSAGPGIIFSSAAQNTLGIAVDNSLLGDYVPTSAVECLIGSDNSKAGGSTGIYLAQGSANGVDGWNSYAFGLQNSAGSNSLTVGRGNSAFGESMAQGTFNSAYYHSIAQGSYCSAANNGQAFGSYLSINSGMAIGNYNKTSSNVAFVIGNGVYKPNRQTKSDLFLISSNGLISGDSIKLGNEINSTTSQFFADNESFGFVHSGYSIYTDCEIDMDAQGLTATYQGTTTTSTNWLNLINSVESYSTSTFVHASATQYIKVATAASIPPTLEENVYYII